MPVNFGDAPTWVAAIGTVGALGAALFQINSERNRRLEAESLQRDELHRAHSRLISAWPGPVIWPPDPNRQVGRTAIDCSNASDEPVYNVVVGIAFIQGAAPRTTEGLLQSDLGQRAGTPTTTLNVLPPGKWRAWIPRSDWASFMGARVGAEIAFTDRAGSHWLRRANGELIELEQDPLSYFAQFGFYPPHEFQKPEPIDPSGNSASPDVFSNMWPDKTAEIREKLRTSERLDRIDLGDITTFDGYRRDAGGQMQRIRIDLRDAGPSAEDERWSVAATDERSGSVIQGDARSTIEEALSTIQWDLHWPRSEPEQPL